DRAEAFARVQHLEVAWELTEARILVYADIGAGDEAAALLTAFEDTHPGSPRIAGLQALVALAQGDRPELVEKLTGDALEAEGLEVPKRMTLERMRALSVFARGRSEEAERLAVELASAAARIGSRVHGAQALALAARAGNPEAWLLRWLGALTLAQGGVSARVQHEGVAALVGEPDPIGAFARTFVSVARARMVDQTPAALRPTMKRTLRQVEIRVVALRKARRAEAETSLDDFVLVAKDEVGLAGSSPALLRPVATMARAAKSNASLVITGETGSGKELFARLAHRLSARKNGPFVAINCAAIPEPLLEAELFGHERGAFTGAERARRGLFVEAEGGTLLLDEVGEMSAAMQVKLLRVLEDREVRAIGGTRGRKVDVRVVAATHRDLAKLVASHIFREDLYYRLAAITVRVPALRERAEDIPAVARALLLRDPGTQRHRFDVPALTVLAEHSWPGNVRELANVIRVAAAMTEGTVIGRPELAEAIGSRAAHVGATDARSFEETTLSALRARHRAEVRELVGRAIASADGNKLRAARALGVSRQGLYRVIGD
ncbi:MAG: sigma 54-interacting transcriptional regulator, partial [Polyangiaceae bacterium]